MARGRRRGWGFGTGLVALDPRVVGIPAAAALRLQLSQRLLELAGPGGRETHLFIRDHLIRSMYPAVMTLNGVMEMVRLLLENGGDPNTTDRSDGMPLVHFNHSGP